MSGKAGGVSGPHGHDREADYRAQTPPSGKLRSHQVDVQQNAPTIQKAFRRATTGQTDRMRGTGGTPKPQPFVDQRASVVIQDTLAGYMVMQPRVMSEERYELPPPDVEEPLPPLPTKSTLRPNQLYEQSPAVESIYVSAEDDEPLPPLPTTPSSHYELEEPLPPIPPKVPLTANLLYEGSSPLYELEEPLPPLPTSKTTQLSPNPLYGRSSTTSSERSSLYELEDPLAAGPLTPSPYDSSLTSPSSIKRRPSSSLSTTSNYMAYTPPPILTATLEGHYVTYTPPPSVLGQPQYVAMRPGYQSATGEKGKPNPPFKDLKQTSGFEIAARAGQLQTIKPFSTKIEHRGKELALTALAAGNGGKRGAEFAQAQFPHYLTEALANISLTQESFSEAVDTAAKQLQADMIAQGITESTSLSIALTTENQVFTAEIGGGATWVKDEGGTYLVAKSEMSPIPSRPRTPTISVKEERVGDDRTTRKWTEGGREYVVMSVTSRRRGSIQRIEQRYFVENGKTSEVYCEVFKSNTNGRSWEKVPTASDIGNPNTPLRVQTAVLPRTPNMELYLLSPEMAQTIQPPDFLKETQGSPPHRQASNLVKQMEEKTEGPLGLVVIRLD